MRRHTDRTHARAGGYKRRMHEELQTKSILAASAVTPRCYMCLRGKFGQSRRKQM